MSDRLPFAKVATLKEVAEGAVRQVPVHDKPVALCNGEGNFYALNAVCTHMGQTVRERQIDRLRHHLFAARMDV